MSGSMKRSSLPGLAGMSLVALAGLWANLAGAGQAPAQPPRTPRAAAPIDLTGNWVAVVTEDWRFRMVIPSKGDYASVPLTDAARKVADAWDPVKDKADGNACKAYGVGNIMRMPTRLKISWVGDTALRIETDAGKQVRNLSFTSVNVAAPRREIGATGGGSPRPDARSQEAETIAITGGAAGPPSLQGTSRAEWERSDLKVTTTNHIGGYLRRNGVPYSETANITEYFYRYAAFGDEWLTVSTVVEDPQYLRQPFLTSSSFKQEANDSKWAPTDCVSEWGPLKQMGMDPFN
jgi:hypothetical protein